MSPVLIIAGVFLTWLLLGKNKKQVTVVSTPSNMPIGITTGFPQPAVSTGTNIASNATQGNTPSAAASGVPDYSQLVGMVSQPLVSPAPVFSNVPSFYQTDSPFHTVQLPAIRSPQVMTNEKPGAGCGCGGSCGSKSDNGKMPLSDCSIARGRSTGDCLSPNRAVQMRDSNKRIFSQWADNIASSPYGLFTAVQATIYNAQANRAPHEDMTEPASPFLTPIGIGSSAPYGN